MEWISVKDKLPYSEQRVLFCDQYGDMHVGCLIKQDNGLLEWFTIGEWLNFHDVIYWLPIEEPPNPLPIKKRWGQKKDFIDTLDERISAIKARNERLQWWVDKHEKDFNKN